MGVEIGKIVKEEFRLRLNGNYGKTENYQKRTLVTYNGNFVGNYKRFLSQENPPFPPLFPVVYFIHMLLVKVVFYMYILSRI